ncbi:MAG: NAD(+) diphosphatase [Burkholderiaceae bacterium]
MLRTPDRFTPLLQVQDHPHPFNLVFCADTVLVREADLLLNLDLASHAVPQDCRFEPVGLLENHYYRATWLPAGSAAPQGYQWRKLRSLFGAIDEGLLAITGRAFQIVEWARTHRFCGACASPTAPMAGERCVHCTQCGHHAYPRISPAMMVLIQRGESILLARHLNSPTGLFTALAGFVEAGESLEEAIHREVLEEVGLQVRDIRYFGSQPWPFPHSLMVAFTAQYAGGEIVLDANEIAEAAWFGPDDALPAMPALGLSIAGHLIHAHLPRSRFAAA